MTGFLKTAVLSIALSVVPLAAHAADARNQLQQFVRQVQSATGEFTQSTVGAQGRTQPAQSGVFSFQRPGKFKWAVKRPYEQLIVSDGKQVMQYDPDLAQVTQRNVDQAIGSSPAAILFGSGSLEQAFNVAGLPDRDGLQWLRATPKTADAGFSRVDLGFRGNVPERVELLDSFGQTTRVTLSNMKANPALAPAEFQFKPPAGVDVVKM